MRDCTFYLSYICYVSIESLSFDSIPIVHDFFDVFPTDLFSFPPELGTLPIVPYCMDPSKLKDLNS